MTEKSDIQFHIKSLYKMHASQMKDWKSSKKRLLDTYTVK